jgi:energy-converting hydrogenase Eha subunit A
MYLGVHIVKLIRQNIHICNGVIVYKSVALSILDKEKIRRSVYT